MCLARGHSLRKRLVPGDTFISRPHCPRPHSTGAFPQGQVGKPPGALEEPRHTQQSMPSGKNQVRTQRHHCGEGQAQVDARNPEGTPRKGNVHAADT